MRALTVIQPWAYAIARCGKSIENRNWGTSYRGPLLIHAGASRTWFTASAVSDIALICPEFPRDLAVATAMVQKSGGEVGGYSAVVAVAELADVVHPADAWKKLSAQQRMWHDPKSHAWVLRNVRALARHVRCGGHQGLWTPHEELVAQVMDELEGKTKGQIANGQMANAEAEKRRTVGGGLFGSSGRMI